MDDQHCPKCGEKAAIAADAEPDVGLMVSLFHCDEHGEFFQNSNGTWDFVEDEYVG